MNENMRKKSTETKLTIGVLYILYNELELSRLIKGGVVLLQSSLVDDSN